VSSFRERYDAFDRYQRRHRWLGFMLAVQQKYGDDQGGYLAAGIAYYAFFSIFPLLLVFVTLLGFALHGDPSLQHRVLSTTLAQLPIVGDQNIRALAGSTLALVVGVIGALWAGMGVFLAAENAMDQLWGISHRLRLDFLHSRGRALVFLVALGGGTLAATAVGGLASFGSNLGLAWKLGSVVLSTALDFGLFWVGFRLLTTRDVTWRSLRGGAVAAAVAYEALQLGGGFYVGHVVKGASETYGTFAIVIGLMSWIYLAVHVTLLAAEGNVVATRKLWPRSFGIVFEQPSTDGDRRALEQRTLVEERRSDERIDVTFDD
jgi:membrane protein